jgi:hypothetical protein
MDERRQTIRLPVAGPGKIIIAIDRPPVECTVMEVSASGASLKVNSAQVLPDHFHVVPGDGDAAGYPCRLKWRKDALVGVQFAD